jgi:inorganic pyrophosphatase
VALTFLGRRVKLRIDRPLGSRHPKHGFEYEVNYGFVPGTLAPDGHELDAYWLGDDGPVKAPSGKCTAIVHRLDDDDDKLVVEPEGSALSDDDIERLVRFQEQYFEHEILRAPPSSSS